MFSCVQFVTDLSYDHILHCGVSHSASNLLYELASCVSAVPGLGFREKNDDPDWPEFGRSTTWEELCLRTVISRQWMFGWVELCSHIHCVGWIFWLECPWYFLCGACVGLVRKGRKIPEQSRTYVNTKTKYCVIGHDLAWLLVLLV